MSPANGAIAARTSQTTGEASMLVEEDVKSDDSLPPQLVAVSPIPHEHSDNSSPQKNESSDNGMEELDSFTTYNESMKNRRYHTKKERKSKGTAGRSWKKLEDPNAPRKPRSGYVHFLSSRRAKYGSAKKGISQKTINVALAAEWQALDATGKEAYNDMARKERTAYDDAMLIYQTTHSYAVFQEKKNYIMKQRKHMRKMGINDSIDLKTLSKMSLAELAKAQEEQQRQFGASPSKRLRKSSESAGTPSLGVDLASILAGSPELMLPTYNPLAGAFKGDVYSKEFIEFNRVREAHLRSMRKNVSLREHEQEQLRKSMQHDGAFALHNAVANDEKTLADSQALLQTWMQIAAAALAGVAVPTGAFSTPAATVGWLETLTSAPTNPALAKSVREALGNANFFPSTTK